jgi:hypothetical protein
MSPSGITDNSSDTLFTNNYDPVTSLVWANAPPIQFTPPAQGGICSGVFHLFGHWSTAGSAQTFTPTTLCNVGTWRAVFDGYWVGPSGDISLPQYDEFTSGSPTQSLGTGTVTIATTSNQLQFSTSGAGGTVYFTGSIDFYPQQGSASATYAGTVTLPNLTFTTGVSCDFGQSYGDTLLCVVAADGSSILDLAANGNVSITSNAGTASLNGSTSATVSASAGPTNLDVSGHGTKIGGTFSPTLIYSHAGTQLAACASGTIGMAWVSDATSLTPGTAYSVSAGAGAITVMVQCTHSGSTYAWQTM